MWREFWGEEVPHTCRLPTRIGFTASAYAERERHVADVLPKQFESAWEAFAEAADTDVAEAVLRVLDDPEPLASELDTCGRTLLHGDLRDENLAIEDGQVILLDWGGATVGHPAVDFAWYLVHDAWRFHATHDEVVEDFRRVRGEEDDPKALELGLISGLVMYGWIFGLAAVIHTDPEERAWARGELDWWVARVRCALGTWHP